MLTTPITFALLVTFLLSTTPSSSSFTPRSDNKSKYKPQPLKMSPSDNTDDQKSPLELFTEMRSKSSSPHAPLLTVGLLADIQYADIPDGTSFGGAPRFYRHALQTTRVAAQHFENERVPFVLNLGDIIDGKCLNEPGGGLRAISHVLEELKGYTCGTLVHAYGNHELYSLTRDQIGDCLKIPFVKEEGGDLVGYRSILATEGVRFVVLDTYDIAMMDRCPETSVKRKEAERLLENYNPNYPESENSPENLEGLMKRWVAFNGGIGQIQLHWLRDTLEKARENKEKVIILSHQPLFPGSSSPVCLVWNYESVLEILRDFGGTVVASFAGHAHRGGYCRDDVSGIHFRVVEAVLESDHPVNTYGFLDIYEDKLVVRGNGDCTSAVYNYDRAGAPRVAKI